MIAAAVEYYYRLDYPLRDKGVPYDAGIARMFADIRSEAIARGNGPIPPALSGFLQGKNPAGAYRMVAEMHLGGAIKADAVEKIYKKHKAEIRKLTNEELHKFPLPWP